MQSPFNFQAQFSSTILDIFQNISRYVFLSGDIK